MEGREGVMQNRMEEGDGEDGRREGMMRIERWLSRARGQGRPIASLSLTLFILKQAQDSRR